MAVNLANITSLDWLVSNAMDVYSKKHPNELVNPRLFSCFIEHSKEGESYYYPVNSIQVVNGLSSEEIVFNVDAYTFCRNPQNIKTSITGINLLNLPPIEWWRCPQIGNGFLYAYSTWEEYYENGIIVLKLYLLER